jgi:hypothetical protein
MTIIQYVRKFNSFATQGHSYFVPILSKTQTIKHVNVLNIHVLLLQLSDFFIFLPARVTSQHRSLKMLSSGLKKKSVQSHSIIMLDR